MYAYERKNENKKSRNYEEIDVQNLRTITSTSSQQRAKQFTWNVYIVT